MLKKIMIALLLIGVLLGGYVYFFMINKSHPDYEKMEADLNISAVELYKDCKNGNALKYTGKTLEVYGTPSKLEMIDSKMVLVYEFSEGMFGAEGIRANFLPHYNDELNKMNIHQPLLIKAYCSGFNDSDVILEKASIIQLKKK